MTRATHSPLFVTKELLDTRYSGAEVIFVAGSVTRGEATTYSDIDLVVIYPKIKQAFRESFTHREWPVEAFVHDPSTVKFFFEKIDRLSASSTLSEMIFEGLEVPGPTTLSQELKTLAKLFLQEGPSPLTDSQIEDRRYHISELLDDIREPNSRQQLIATSTILYNELADYFFRSKRAWSSQGKSLFKKMKKADPVFARRFFEGFDILFATGRPEKVIELAEEMLQSNGGILFDGYKREAPTYGRP